MGLRAWGYRGVSIGYRGVERRGLSSEGCIGSCLGYYNRPRGSTYTTSREFGPISPSIVWYFGASFPNSCIYGPTGRGRNTIRLRSIRSGFRVRKGSRSRMLQCSVANKELELV